MYLIIDIGNTRAKIAQYVSGELSQLYHCLENELESLLSQNIPNADKVLLSSVKEPSKSFLSFLHKQYPSVLLLASTLQMPFKNAYETPQSLGPDRMALVAGGLKLFPNTPLLIVDVGTCITYDFVDENAIYYGGAISPGLHLRLKALNQFTGKLPLVKLKQPKDLIGRNTQESILSGVVNGMLNEIDGVLDTYKLRYPKIKIVLTGGDLTFFDKKLKNSIFADANVLLEGMLFILEQNLDEKN